MQTTFNAKEAYEAVSSEEQMRTWLAAVYAQMYDEISLFALDPSPAMKFSEKVTLLDKQMEHHTLGMGCVSYLGHMMEMEIGIRHIDSLIYRVDALKARVVEAFGQ